MVTRKQVEESLSAVANASGKGLLMASEGLRNVQIMGSEVILDVVSDSPVLHQKKKLEVEDRKSVV